MSYYTEHRDEVLLKCKNRYALNHERKVRRYYEITKPNGDNLRIYTLKELGEYLGISESWTCKVLRKGEYLGHKIQKVI